MHVSYRTVFRPGEVSESFVTVTLPFHPLAGRRLRVLGQQRSHRGLELDCDGGDLGRVRLPARGRTGWPRRLRAGSAPAVWPADRDRVQADDQAQAFDLAGDAITVGRM